MSSEDLLRQRARRTHSLPSRYMIPSEDMGEYESPMRRRSAPEREKPTVVSPGGLYPLSEQGEYGQPPRAPKAPLPFKRREIKPKVYSSYSVDRGCDVHCKNLCRMDSARKSSVASSINGGTSSVRSSMSPAPERRMRTVSASPSRQSVFNGYHTPNCGRQSESPEPFSRKISSDAHKKNSSTSSPSSSSSWTRQRDSFNSDSYQCEENRMSIMKSSSKYGSYSSSNNIDHSNGSGKNISLDSLRQPKVVSWDSMGILGLSNRMWSETKARQDTFFQTGQLLKEDSYSNSYIM